MAGAAITGLLAYGLKSSEDAKREAGKERERQAAEATRLRGEFAARQADQESTLAADTARKQARKRQLSLSTGGQSRQDTILTQGIGASGVAGASAPQQKTLLGM